LANHETHKAISIELRPGKQPICLLDLYAQSKRLILRLIVNLQN